MDEHSTQGLLRTEEVEKTCESQRNSLQTPSFTYITNRSEGDRFCDSFHPTGWSPEYRWSQQGSIASIQLPCSWASRVHPCPWMLFDEQALLDQNCVLVNKKGSEDGTWLHSCTYTAELSWEINKLLNHGAALLPDCYISPLKIASARKWQIIFHMQTLQTLWSE